MTCSRCASVLPDSSRFCANCGERVQAAGAVEIEPVPEAAQADSLPAEAATRKAGPGSPSLPSSAATAHRWRPRLLKGAAVLTAFLLVLFLLEQIPAVRRLEQRITMSSEHRQRLDMRVERAREDKTSLNALLWYEWLSQKEEATAGRSSKEWEEQMAQANALAADLAPARRKEAYCEYWTIQQRALDDAIRDAWASGLDHGTDPIEFEARVFEAVRQAEAKAMFTGPNLDFTDIGLVQGLQPGDDAVEGWCDSCCAGEVGGSAVGHRCHPGTYRGEFAATAYRKPGCN